MRPQGFARRPPDRADLMVFARSSGCRGRLHGRSRIEALLRARFNPERASGQARRNRARRGPCGARWPANADAKPPIPPLSAQPAAGVPNPLRARWRSLPASFVSGANASAVGKCASMNQTRRRCSNESPEKGMPESALSIRISQRPKPTSPFLESECLVRCAAARPLRTTSETVSAMSETATSASSFADRPSQPMSANATSPRRSPRLR